MPKAINAFLIIIILTFCLFQASTVADFLKPDFRAPNCLGPLDSGHFFVSLTLDALIKGRVFPGEERWRDHAALWPFFTKATALFNHVAKDTCVRLGLDVLSSNYEFFSRLLSLLFVFLSYIFTFFLFLDLIGDRRFALLAVALMAAQVHYFELLFIHMPIFMTQFFFILALFFYSKSLSHSDRSLLYLFAALLSMTVAVNANGSSLFAMPLLFLAEFVPYVLRRERRASGYHAARIVFIVLFGLMMAAFYMLPVHSVRYESMEAPRGPGAVLWFVAAFVRVEPFYFVMYIISLVFGAVVVFKNKFDDRKDMNLIFFLLLIITAYPFIIVYLIYHSMSFRLYQTLFISSVFIFVYLIYYSGGRAGLFKRPWARYAAMIALLLFFMYQGAQYKRLENVLGTYPRWLGPLGIRPEETVEILDEKMFYRPFDARLNTRPLRRLRLRNLADAGPSVKYVVVNADHFDELVDLYPGLEDIDIISRRRLRNIDENMEGSAPFGVFNFYYPSVWPDFKRERLAIETLYLVRLDDLLTAAGKNGTPLVTPYDVRSYK